VDVALDAFGRLESGKAPWPGRTTRTDAEGWYRFTDLPPGFYTAAPGYPPDDGWAFVFEIQPGLQVDLAAGQVDTLTDGVVLDAIRPLEPPVGSRIETLTPRLSWEALDGAEYYELSLALGHLFGRSVRVDSTSVTLDAPLSPGAAVRWNVFAFDEGVVIGAFEVFGTFTTFEP